jgi:Flp pilus assembly protein TadG
MLSEFARRRAADDRGAVLVMSTLTIVTLMMVAGLVVDVALVRTDRTQNKSVADMAVTAGLRTLELGGYPAPFRGVCEALKFLQANSTEMAALTGSITWATGTPVTGDPCSPTSAYWQHLCVPNDQTTWAAYHGTAQSGRITVDIKSGYLVSDGSFNDEPPSGVDSGDTVLGGCDNLAVIIAEQETPSFARAAFDGQMTSRIRTVGRVTQTFDIRAVVALLILERHDCDALTFNGTNAAIQVLGYGTHPGIIHSDSIGNGENCNNQILNGAAVTTGGTPAYAGPGILAESAQTGNPPEPGRISVSALYGLVGAVPARASTPCPNTAKGTSLDPAIPHTCAIGSSRKGRINVDVLYRSRIKALQADAAQKTALTSAPLGYTPYNNCNAVPAVVTDSKVWINCNQFNNAVVFNSSVKEVIFTGSVSGSADITFVEPDFIYVGNGLTRTGGTLKVNMGSSLSCNGRAADDRFKTTKLVVANGDFKTSGGANLHLCSTTVLMGDDTGANPAHPAIPATDGVEPYDNNFDGVIGLAGGGTLDWTAPNAASVPMEWNQAASQPYLDDFEDLAFWTEASDSSALSGGAQNNMVGVFFLPNAEPFNLSGNGGQIIESNAQFIARKLTMGGNGVLKLRPNPNDAISVPYFSNFALVR